MAVLPDYGNKIWNTNFFLKLIAILLYIIFLFYAISAQSDIFSIAIATITLLVILLLFFPFKIETNRSFMIFLLLILLIGTLLRLWLAYAYFGNFDMNSYSTVSEIVLSGQNVYNTTPYYNYSPIWFNLLGSLRIISDSLPISFHFAVRGFLTIIDIFTLILLLIIGISEGLTKNGLIRLSLLFYLNPISYLITGYHGQFENLALFFIVLGLFFFFKMKNGNTIFKYLSWLSFSAGLIVKHNTLIMAITGITNIFKKGRYIAFFFFITVVLFLLSFIYYWIGGSQGIISHVFMYGGISGIYGVTSFIKFPALKYIFVAGLLVYPLIIQNRDIVDQLLLGSLFFLTFTTGIGIQYFVLPVVFGALRPSNWFLLYTFITSIVIIGAVENLDLFGFSFFSFNAVWICALFWFIFTHFKIVGFFNFSSLIKT